MKSKKTRLQLEQDKVEEAINKTNEKIKELGTHTSSLYEKLNDIQELFDKIRNVPTEKKLQYEELKQIRLNWKQQAEKIKEDYKAAAVKSASAGTAGAGVGVAVATMGPTVAMGVATTFGVASTGTAISALSGAAATNAALAWLGGGALAAGGGGMAAGQAFLVMAGPVGWAIAGVALITSGVFFWKNMSDQKYIEDVFIFISERDTRSYDLAIVELNERIKRIINEKEILKSAIGKIYTFGFDYNKMTEAQQYELGSYVNLMLSSTQLLINPIKGLMPKYSEEDFDEYVSWDDKKAELSLCKDYKMLIVSLANFLYKIYLNDRDKKLLWESLRENKEMLKSMNVSKKEFKISIIDAALEALNYKYTFGEEFNEWDNDSSENGMDLPETYLTNLYVISGETTPAPSGYQKINYDLNKGAGGDFIYLCYKREREGAAINDIAFITGKDSPVPEGYTKIDFDLNKGAGGDYIYLCYQKGEVSTKSIVDLKIIVGDNAIVPNGFRKIPMDLNRGAGGEYIYLCVKHANS